MTLYRLFLKSFTIAALVLAACSPQFNWRMVQNQETGYVATYPDKPVKVTRSLNMMDLRVPLTIEAAQVQGIYFAVGTVLLQGDLEGKGEALRKALAQAAVNNIGGGMLVLTPQTWLKQKAWFLQSQGSLPDGNKAQVQVRFFEYRKYLVQVMMIAPAKDFDADITLQWFNGFSLIGQ